MYRRFQLAGLDVAAPISEFVDETVAGECFDRTTFWQGVSDIVRDLTPRNQKLLAERERMQSELDS